MRPVNNLNASNPRLRKRRSNPLHFCIICDDGKNLSILNYATSTLLRVHSPKLLVGEGHLLCRTSAPPATPATFTTTVRSSRTKYPLKHYTEYALLLLFGATIRLFPLRIALLFGWLVALIGHHLVRFRRAEARRRIQHVLGKSLTPAQINKIAWISWRNLCFNAIEAIRFKTLTRKNLPADNSITPYIDTLKKQLKNSTSGAILATIHMGNWDLAGIIADLHQIPIFSIARRQKNSLTDAYLNRARKSFNMEVLSTRITCQKRSFADLSKSITCDSPRCEEPTPGTPNPFSKWNRQPRSWHRPLCSAMRLHYSALHNPSNRMEPTHLHPAPTHYSRSHRRKKSGSTAHDGRTHGSIHNRHQSQSRTILLVQQTLGS